MKNLFNTCLFLALLVTLSFTSTDVNANSISVPEIGELSGVGQHYELQSFDFSHDDKYIVTSYTNGRIAVWDATNTTLLTSWEASKKEVNNVIYNHDSSKIISTDRDGKIKVWDVSSGSLIQSIDSPSKESIYDIVLNTDGSILYSADHDRSVRFWDINSGDMIREITLTSNPISLAYNPLDNHIAIITRDGSLNIRDSNDGSYIFAINNKRLEGSECNIQYTSDYQTLFASYSLIGQPILFNVSDNYEEINLNNDDFKIESNADYLIPIDWLDFDLDDNNKYVAVYGGSNASGGNKTYIFDINTKKLVTTLEGHGGPIKFNYEGNRILARHVIFDSSQLPNKELVGIEVNPKMVDMKTNETKEISVKKLFDDGTSEDLKLSDIKFTSDNTQIADMLYGKINSYKEGTATITANYKEFKTGIKVIVQNYEVLDKKYDVLADKTWNVKFNMNVDIDTIKEKNIYITDSNNNILPMFYYSEKGQETNIRLMPVKDYNSGENYTLWIKELKSETGSKLKRYTKMEFQVK